MGIENRNGHHELLVALELIDGWFGNKPDYQVVVAALSIASSELGVERFGDLDEDQAWELAMILKEGLSKIAQQELMDLKAAAACGEGTATGGPQPAHVDPERGPGHARLARAIERHTRMAARNGRKFDLFGIELLAFLSFRVVDLNALTDSQASQVAHELNLSISGLSLVSVHRSDRSD